MPEQLSIDFALTREERMIYNILQNCKGKDAAILGANIASLTGISYDDIRQIISHLVNEHHCLIASYSRGYYIPVTAGEVEAATRSLRHRGIMILMRAARLQKQSLEDIFHQGKMEFMQ